MSRVACSVIVVVWLAIYANGANSFWSFGDSLDDIWNSLGSQKSTPIIITTSAPTLPTNGETMADSSAAGQMRRIIQEELSKLQETDNIPKKKTLPIDGTTTENPADMIRRIISEELAKALSSMAATVLPTANTAETTQASIQLPAQPIWKSWANEKYWAKQPGPNGQAAPGFISSLQNRFGTDGGMSKDVVHPSGSPGWVWQQIVNKWATKSADPTIVPPSQIVDNGAWEMVMPPQSVQKSTGQVA